MYTDYELYQILEANGYKTTEKNLQILKEGLESGEYEVLDEGLGKLWAGVKGFFTKGKTAKGAMAEYDANHPKPVKNGVKKETPKPVEKEEQKEVVKQNETPKPVEKEEQKEVVKQNETPTQTQQPRISKRTGKPVRAYSRGTRVYKPGTTRTYTLKDGTVVTRVYNGRKVDVSHTTSKTYNTKHAAGYGEGTERSNKKGTIKYTYSDNKTNPETGNTKVDRTESKGTFDIKEMAIYLLGQGGCSLTEANIAAVMTLLESGKDFVFIDENYDLTNNGELLALVENDETLYYSDYELYQLLEAEGYKTTEENLEILKEGVEAGTYEIIVE